jgi:hypothetical protein
MQNQPDLSRLSLNQATTQRWSSREVAEGAGDRALAPDVRRRPVGGRHTCPGQRYGQSPGIASEVEIFNLVIWDTPGDQVLAPMRDRYLACV